MMCPALPVRLIQSHLIQTAAAVSFEVAHDALRWNPRVHHGVHVIASRMGRRQAGAAMPTHLLNRFQYGVAPDLVQVVGGLIHTFRRGCGALAIRFQVRGSRHIVLAIDGARLVAVQVASIAGKGNQINHRPQLKFYCSPPLPDGRGSDRRYTTFLHFYFARLRRHQAGLRQSAASTLLPGVAILRAFIFRLYRRSIFCWSSKHRYMAPGLPNQ